MIGSYHRGECVEPPHYAARLLLRCHPGRRDGCALPARYVPRSAALEPGDDARDLLVLVGLMLSATGFFVELVASRLNRRLREAMAVTDERSRRFDESARARALRLNAHVLAPPGCTTARDAHALGRLRCLNRVLPAQSGERPFEDVHVSVRWPTVPAGLALERGQAAARHWRTASQIGKLGQGDNPAGGRTTSRTTSACGL